MGIGILPVTMSAKVASRSACSALRWARRDVLFLWTARHRGHQLGQSSYGKGPALPLAHQKLTGERIQFRHYVSCSQLHDLRRARLQWIVTTWSNIAS